MIPMSSIFYKFVK